MRLRAVSSARNRDWLLARDPDIRAHPGMDAALIVFDALVVFHFARGLARLEDRAGGLYLRALRDLGQAQDVVDRLEEAAAKFLHLGEGVHLAAMIDRGKYLTDFERHFVRSHVPRPGGMMACQLVD